ncbi:MAG: tryptophan--tRNA ligase [Candidatus Omnitrophica bacterium]|nr:tryptophan--tRNA ligase [Candidatus Omnitrophota bacterium]MDD5080478.1 tryptophan--tRNA ligase [Candidatus Omnitrophota bacterium]MDD5440738.1 tryptophan--tRNA ligase [Candidatus Omnitrophota bacterium]
MSVKKKVIFSGMRPTGKLHLGHWLGALSNWVELQDEYSCYFMVADWHALMSEYKDTSRIADSILDNVCDWLAYGIDPDKSTIFVQSEVYQHLELYMILSTMVPLGWLYRCPTFKEQMVQLKDKEVNNYAFLGYPILQAADIILYKADVVPVGEDQLPHLELCREIVRRFHSITDTDMFSEPQAILTPIVRLLGLDGRKMSKSYDNYIALDEEPGSLKKKIMAMFTDQKRLRRDDPGTPDDCNVYAYYKAFCSDKLSDIKYSCESAGHGCVECKKTLLERVGSFLEEHRERKQELIKKKDYVYDILKEGKKKAQACAEQTIIEVRKAIKF